jgi:Na+/proline symporter
LANQDELLLDYISTNVPTGVKGLIIAGLFAAAMSTVTGSLSALSSSTLFDLFPNLAKRPDAMTWSRAAMVFWAAVFVSFATMFSLYFTSQDPIVIIALRIAGFTYGALLGAFVVGRFTKVDSFSAYVGFFATISIMATIISISMFVTKSAFPWYTFIGCSIYVITALSVDTLRSKVKG